ncbi:MAG: histidinol-phosphate transaminase [Flavobacteriaceae bacterium]|nr:histidinol-phosphate transaminase [Flavobacteriaceae bacterium]MDG2313941.1 histidinol-phosphate transaminase [Flavobacteriaceae bacterium]
MKTNFNLSKWVRTNVLNLKAYSSARDEFSDPRAEMTFLDANENPFDNGINRYPDPQQKVLKAALASLKGVDPQQILLGNGSDEVLDLIFRVFCEPNQDEVITLPPTYGMYSVLANTNAVANIEVPLTENFQPNVSAILKKVTPKTKALLLCSPNNPSGNSFDADVLQALISQFPGIVVVDEAYIDFSSQQSLLTNLNDFPNLIVTQTFSKAYGMAGIRLGACYASIDIIALLNRIKPPYNINVLTQQRALEGLANQRHIQAQVETLLQERNRIQKALESVSIVEKIYPSDANFILAKVDDAALRYQQLIEKEIVTRNRSNQLLCNECLRFTVGTPEENDRLIEALNTLSC